jgi:hypothetical protein
MKALEACILLNDTETLMYTHVCNFEMLQFLLSFVKSLHFVFPFLYTVTCIIHAKSRVTKVIDIFELWFRNINLGLLSAHKIYLIFLFFFDK